MTILIDADRLSKSFGPIRAVDDISLQVTKGEVLGFLGPNGAGKSTTMKMLTGFLEPDSGSARVCRLDVSRQPKAAKASLGYLPEGAPAYGDMTPARFLDFIAEIRGFEGAAKAQARRRRGRAHGARGRARSSGSRRCPRASSAASASPRRSCTTRPCSSWTSRPTASIPTRSTRCASSSPRWRRTRPSSSPPTSWRRWRRCARAPSSSTAAASSPTARPRT